MHDLVWQVGTQRCVVRLFSNSSGAMTTWVDHFVMGSDNRSGSWHFDDGIIISSCICPCVVQERCTRSKVERKCPLMAEHELRRGGGGKCSAWNGIWGLWSVEFTDLPGTGHSPAWSCQHSIPLIPGISSDKLPDLHSGVVDWWILWGEQPTVCGHSG